MIATAEAAVAAFYWDASALLSVLVADAGSNEATALAARTVRHLVSTLAYAEVASVLHRSVRPRVLSKARAQSVLQQLSASPWHPLTAGPERALLERHAAQSRLRGADLWHLGMALTLAAAGIEVGIVTFDRRLRDAAAQTGLAVLPG